MFSYILKRRRSSKRDKLCYSDFVRYFIVTAKNSMGYDFIKRCEFDVNKSMDEFNRTGCITFKVISGDKDFKALCYRNGIDINVDHIKVRVEFVRVNIRKAYNDYRSMRYGDFNLDDLIGESKLIIYGSEALNSFHIDEVFTI